MGGGGANRVLVLISVNSLTWGQFLIVPMQQVKTACTTAAGLNVVETLCGGQMTPPQGSHCRYPAHQILHYNP